MSSLEHLALSIITLFAASVNGALGYGFSSLTVPLALLFLTNRTLNPALVLIEVVLNGYVLFVNRQSLPPVWRRMVPLIVGLAPGVFVGTRLVAQLDPALDEAVDLRLPDSADSFQAAGYRRPLGWGAGIRPGLRGWSRRALLGDHHFGPAARVDAQQRRIRQARVPGSAWSGEACGVVDDGGRVLWRQACSARRAWVSRCRSFRAWLSASLSAPTCSAA